MRKVYKYRMKTGRPVDYSGSIVDINRRKRQAARHRLNYNVRVGKVNKLPCEYLDCNNPNSEGHHPDYNFPLDIIWLCKAHHTELHNNLQYEPMH